MRVLRGLPAVWPMPVRVASSYLQSPDVLLADWRASEPDRARTPQPL